MRRDVSNNWFSSPGHLLPKAPVKCCLRCLQLSSTLPESFKFWWVLRAPCFHSGILLVRFTAGVSAGNHVAPCSATEPFGLYLRSDESPVCSFSSCTASYWAPRGLPQKWQSASSSPNGLRSGFPHQLPCKSDWTKSTEPIFGSMVTGS